MKNNKGFSLVELIVVIAIMAILAAVAIPTFATFIQKANLASDEQFVADLKYSIELANAKFGEDVELTEVTATNGAISEVKYTIGDATVTITIGSEDETAAATGTSVTAAKLAEYESAADDVIESIDWSYSFKHADYQSGLPSGD